MNVVIDISQSHSENKARGVGMYAKFLHENLLSLSTKHTFTLKQETLFESIPDLIHYPYFDFFFPTLPLKNIAPTIITIHDTIPLIFPNHYKPGIRGKFNYIKQRLLVKNAHHIITNSITSKNDITTYLDVPSNKVTPISMAADESFTSSPITAIPKEIRRLNVQKPYFLYVGDINYNKNISFLLDGFKSFSKTHTLVMVSRSLENDIPESREIRSRIIENNLDSSVLIASKIPSIPVTALNWLYQNAIAHIQPSLYEGFGIPVIEALRSGTIVVSSTGGALKEFKSDAIFPVDPLDAKTLTDCLKKVISLSKTSRETLIASGKTYAQSFSWKKTAKETIAVYELIANTSL